MNAPIPVADAHNDLLLACLHRHERGVADPFGDDWLPGLRQGGVTFQVLPMFTEDQFVGEAALRRTLLLIEMAHEIAATHAADVALVTSPADIDAALAHGQIALLLALEGAEPVGSSVELFETFARLGVRMASLTWNRRTMMADGIAERATGGALTTLGVEAVQEMDRLGMVIDISHLSAPGVDHLARIVDGPFVASHSSCRQLSDHPRNLTDEHIAAVARSGGFVGINAFAPFVKPPHSPGGPATIDDYIDHLEHVAAVASPDCTNAVAIGADFIFDLVRLVDPILGKQLLVRLDDIEFIDGFRAPGDYQNLTERLVARVGEPLARRFAADNMIDFFRNHLC